ncbi:MAG: hypothetical protein ACOY4I_07670 [Bacillota bacterium]
MVIQDPCRHYRAKKGWFTHPSDPVKNFSDIEKILNPADILLSGPFSMISIDTYKGEWAVTTKELAEAGCYSFEGILNFNGELVIERTVSILEREDGVTEKIVSYGLCIIAGLYISISILGVLF